MNGVPPLITEVARPWWDALTRDEIVVQRCEQCTQWVFYPRAFCPGCGGRSLTWTGVSGDASLYSWSVANVPVSPLFEYLHEPILAIVELSVGVRVPTRLVDVERGAVEIGMALTPVFDHKTYPEASLLYFRPA